MATRRLKRPRDPIQLGKLVVDIATGQIEDREEDGKDPTAVARGVLGGKKGGATRAQNLTADQRRKAATHAARSRWNRAKSDKQ
jgi:hypothetical protein